MLHSNFAATNIRRNMTAQTQEQDFSEEMTAVASHGDKDAFARLFAHFAPRVKAFLLKQGADQAQAEELMQETMVTVWQKAYQFDRRKAKVSTWIFTISRNRRIDRLRKESRANVDLTDPALVPDPLEDSETSFERSENRERIERALTGLSADQTKVIRLCFYSDMSHSEIAEKLDIPIGTVKSRIRLAIAKIKAALEDS